MSTLNLNGSARVLTLGHDGGTVRLEQTQGRVALQLVVGKGDKGDKGDPGAPGTPGSGSTDNALRALLPANIMDPAYGAVGNGIADDSAALSAALATGRPVYIPANRTILAQNVTYTGTVHIFGDGRTSVLKSTGQPILTLAPAGIGSTTDWGSISRVHIDCTANRAPGAALITVRFLRNFRLDQVTSNLTGTGLLFAFDTTYQTVISSCNFRTGRYAVPWEVDATADPTEQMDTFLVSNTVIDGTNGAIYRHANGNIHTVRLDGYKQHSAATAGDWGQYAESRVAAPTAAGDTTLTWTTMTSGTFAVNDPIVIGSGNTVEVAKVTAVSGTTLTVSAPLRFAHVAAEQILAHGYSVSFGTNTYAVRMTGCHWEGPPVGALFNGVKGFTAEDCWNGAGEFMRSTGADARVTLRHIAMAGMASRNILVEVIPENLTNVLSIGPFVVEQPIQVSGGPAYVVFDAQGSTTSAIQRRQIQVNVSSGFERTTATVPTSGGSEKFFLVQISAGDKAYLTYQGGYYGQSYATERAAKTANYTVTVNDVGLIAVTDTTAARTITLPGASAWGTGRLITIKDESGAAATNNITVSRAGSDTIEGAATKAINTNFGVLRLYSTGSGWMTA